MDSFDPVIANAILDRISHHTHVIPINGKAHRLKDHFKEEDE
ncbi:ATP-binding protein [Clostridiaceae bacterium 35-E11]